MTRLLLRAPKSPFDVVPPRKVLDENLIWDNVGNLVFIDAAWKILDAPGVEVTADRAYVRGAHAADVINERFDAYAVPLANAFRPSFELQLDRMTRLLERLRIPIVVLGVGAQGSLTYETDRLRPMEGSIRAFVRAVLDRSPSIGVRGEMTHDYLVGLGFRDVEVIGCPSMFLWGSHLQVEKRADHLDRTSRVALNISPYVGAMGPIAVSNAARYPNLVYIAQDIITLRLLLWGEAPEAAAKVSERPVHSSHPLFQENRTRFYVEPWPWMAALREVDFAFGSRIHGNIAALLAGTPAYVLAHDSRTLELARYFQIPHRVMTETAPDVDAADLYEEADFGPMHAGHAARFATFIDYLERHGLAHVFAPGGDGGVAFDERVSRIAYPPAIDVSSAVAHPTSLAARLQRARWRLVLAARSPQVQRVRLGVRRRLRRVTRRTRAPGGTPPGG